MQKDEFQDLASLDMVTALSIELETEKSAQGGFKTTETDMNLSERQSTESPPRSSGSDYSSPGTVPPSTAYSTGMLSLTPWSVGTKVDRNLDLAVPSLDSCTRA